jgi:hypothetical protein
VQEPDEHANSGAVERRHLRDVQHDVGFERQQSPNDLLQLFRLRTADNLPAARDDNDLSNTPHLKGYRHLCSFRVPALDLREDIRRRDQPRAQRGRTLVTMPPTEENCSAVPRITDCRSSRRPGSTPGSEVLESVRKERLAQC